MERLDGQVIEIGGHKARIEYDSAMETHMGVFEGMESPVTFYGATLEELETEGLKSLEVLGEIIGEEAGAGGEAPRKSPLRSIRLKCLECSGGSSPEVAKCELSSCALHPYRFGRNPWRPKRELSEEQRAAMIERLRRGRETQARNQGAGEAGLS